MTTKYSELLRDPRWQKTRLKKLEAAEWRCERCMDDATTLNVHHKRYVKGRMPWEYDEAELAVLCEPCHGFEHEEQDLRTALVARLAVDGPFSADEFFAFGAGTLPEHLADDATRLVIDYYRKSRPGSFAAGRFVQNFDYCGIGRHGFEWLAEQADPSNKSTFRDELFDLLKKHKAPILSLRHEAGDA